MIFKRFYRKDRTKDVVIVTDEGEYPIWERDFERLFSGLNPGDDIEDCEKLIHLAVRREIKKSTVRKISAGNVTKMALVGKICREKMFGIYPNRNEVELIVDKLASAGFINDAAYAARYVERCCDKNWGEFKIRASMREKGFTSEDIEKAIGDADPDWESMASDFLQTLTEEFEREALFRKLQARGFSTSTILNVLD